MTNAHDLLPHRPPTAARPLLGVTVLVVEDSRFASEAVRLMCLRSGARIRRADSLANARRHLRIYRPTCVLVDLGLPDGSGEDLLAEVARASPPIEVILATSGDADAAPRALAAGAQAFLPKPLTSLAAFQQTILSALPPDRRPSGPRTAAMAEVTPDAIALRDDLATAQRHLSESHQDGTVDYVARFLAGLAHSAGDNALGDAVDRLMMRRAAGQTGASELASLSALLDHRIAAHHGI